MVARTTVVAEPASAQVQPAGTGEPAFTNSAQNTQWFEWPASQGADAYRIRFDYYESNVLQGSLIRPKALGPPSGGPSALELCSTGAPVLPDRTPAGGWSGAPCRLMGDRRDADLRARHWRTWPAPARVTTEWPAVRVIARGGGGDPDGNELRSLCLTQRRELRGRVDGRAHQLAERALPRAAGGRRGEHVFGRLGRGSDGTR